MLTLDAPAGRLYEASMTPHELAVALRAMRVAAGLSQSALAAKLACTRSNISLVEGGHHWPTSPMLLAWTEACGRQVAFIDPAIGEALASVPHQDQERTAKIILRLAGLSESHRVAVDALLSALTLHKD